MEVIVPLRTRPFLPPDFEEIERTVSTQDQYINIFERHQNGPDVRRGSINLSITQDEIPNFTRMNELNLLVSDVLKFSFFGNKISNFFF